MIVKDHTLQGPLAWLRVSFIDWAANAPYGVPCLFRYHDPAEWRSIHERHGFRIAEELLTMDLYPPVVNFLFGRRLQYFTVVEPGGGVNG